MGGPVAAEGEHLGSVGHAAKQKLERPHLIATKIRRRQVIALDPQRLRRGEVVDRGREAPERCARDGGEGRKASEEREAEWVGGD
jgi:hypothetical protein